MALIPGEVILETKTREVHLEGGVCHLHKPNLRENLEYEHKMIKLDV